MSSRVRVASVTLATPLADQQGRVPGQYMIQSGAGRAACRARIAGRSQPARPPDGPYLMAHKWHKRCQKPPHWLAPRS